MKSILFLAIAIYLCAPGSHGFLTDAFKRPENGAVSDYPKYPEDYQLSEDYPEYPEKEDYQLSEDYPHYPEDYQLSKDYPEYPEKLQLSEDYPAYPEKLQLSEDYPQYAARRYEDPKNSCKNLEQCTRPRCTMPFIRRKVCCKACKEIIAEAKAKGIEWRKMKELQ